MTIHKKLVRDFIPALIESSGNKATVRVLEKAEYRMALTEKVIEEYKEFCSAESDEERLEELADLQELLNALTEEFGFTKEQVETTRFEKAKQRGGFKERLFLVEVHE